MLMLEKIKSSLWLYKRRLNAKERIKALLKGGTPLMIEIGAGSKSGENGWVTLDVVPGCDIYWDLLNGLPFPDESVQQIYSSHFFEHLTFREGQKMLDECLRVLVPEGIFSIVVPNARLYIAAYINNENLDENKFFVHKQAYNNTTKIDYVNHIAYMDGDHKYMFDEENLIRILQVKGFKNVHLRDFDPNLDLNSRNTQSIYAEAQK